jgi:hypothetical protein
MSSLTLTLISKKTKYKTPSKKKEHSESSSGSKSGKAKTRKKINKEDLFTETKSDFLLRNSYAYIKYEDKDFFFVDKNEDKIENDLSNLADPPKSFEIVYGPYGNFISAVTSERGVLRKNIKKAFESAYRKSERDTFIENKIVIDPSNDKVGIFEHGESGGPTGKTVKRWSCG